MSNEQKILLMDKIIELVKENNIDKNYLDPIGVLTKETGIKGFKTMKVDDIVFEKDSKYCLVMETLDGKNNTIINFNKETLAPFIKFFN